METLGYIFTGIFVMAFIGLLVLPKGSKAQNYCKNVCIGYDQLVNAITFGYPDETISSRAHKGKLRGNKGWALLAYILNTLDPGHTLESVEWDEGTNTSSSPLYKDTKHKQ